MKITVLGLGHVGLTSAACLLSEGHEVTGIDPDEGKLAELLAGRCPISEPGLDELLQKGFASGRFRISREIDTALLLDCAIVIVCVGTPNAADGSHDLSQVIAASRQIAARLRQRQKSEPMTVVYRSTMWPGSIERTVQPIFESEIGDGGGSTVELVYNPEFMRESSAVTDYFNPARIVLGTADGTRPEKLLEVYANIKAPIFITTFAEAELTKLVDNSWHALKVAYANEIGRISIRLGVRASRVHEIFVADTKLNISPRYTRPGGAFGGPCLPKDLRALSLKSHELGEAAPLISSVIASNDAHKRFLFAHCTKGLRAGARILMIGFAFKPGSDDIRESQNVELARELDEAGYKLSIYDPFIRRPVHGHDEAPIARLLNLVVTADEAERAEYDIVIDTFGSGDGLALKAAARVDVRHLE